AQALGGTEGAGMPFWSPDGGWIGFFAEGKLKKVKVSGGAPQDIANASNARGGAWNRDGVILFGLSINGPLMQVRASGGEPTQVTELDTSQEASHRWPQFLPDGRHFLYFILSGDPQRQGMYAGSLDSNQKIRLVPTPVSGIYGMGILLFVHEQALLGQRLDAKGFRLVGDPFPVA